MNTAITQSSLKQSGHYPDRIRVKHLDGQVIAEAYVLYCGLQYVEEAAIALALSAPAQWTPTRQWEIIRGRKVVARGEVDVPRK